MDWRHTRLAAHAPARQRARRIPARGESLSHTRAPHTCPLSAPPARREPSAVLELSLVVSSWLRDSDLCNRSIMAVAADRIAGYHAELAADRQLSTLGATRPEFVKFFHSRVERSAKLSMYTRAHEDSRPASIAHPLPADSQWGSVALSATVSRSFLESATGSAIAAAYAGLRSNRRCGHVRACALTDA